jgi:hypothetical protein
MTEDEEIWKANTHRLPWIKDIEVGSVLELLTLVIENQDSEEMFRYFFKEPEIMLNCRLILKKWTFSVTCIVVRHTHQNHGYHICRGIMQECTKRHWNFCLHGPFTTKGKGLAKKLGLVQNLDTGHYSLF